MSIYLQNQLILQVKTEKNVNRSNINNFKVSKKLKSIQVMI